jgi:hypothetical protein
MTPLVIVLMAFLSHCPAAAQGSRSFTAQGAFYDVKAIDFCARGKFVLFTGKCSLTDASKYKDSVSQKACNDVSSIMSSGLRGLYPYAEVEVYNNFTADELLEKFMQPSVLGFFFVGEGDAKGRFITGADRDLVSPAMEYCVSVYDVFGGFISHSKYSPDIPAPKNLQGLILSKTELVYNGAGGAVKGSWARLCKPKISLVYPTRTFAGRMKNDAFKLLGELKEQKKKQVLKVLDNICAVCDQYTQANHPVAALCPPNSDLCKVKQIVPGSENLLMENYCLAIHPEYVEYSK